MFMITCSDENFWSVLYLTGYLTSCNPDRLFLEDRERVKGSVMALMIPNAEIRGIYQDTVLKWFEESTHSWKTQNLCEAVWQGDGETAEATYSVMELRFIKKNALFG